MYAVTQDFNDVMRADKRQVNARVTIDYTDPTIDQSITVSASEQANVSYPQQTADSVSAATNKWASLDGSWVLDGTWHLAPEPEDLTQYQFGWWSAQLADSTGTFASPYPTLTVTHIARPIQSLRVVGDSARGEYPVDLTIQLYDASNTLLYSQNVTGNTQMDWSLTLASPVLNVTKQVLTVTKWSHPGRQAKVLEFFTSIQETYESGDVVEIKLIEEREASQGSLPVGNISANEITIGLANEGRKFDVTNPNSPLAGLLKPNRRIRAWLGLKGDGDGQNVTAQEQSQADFATGTLSGVQATADGLQLMLITGPANLAPNPTLRDGNADNVPDGWTFTDIPGGSHSLDSAKTWGGLPTWKVVTATETGYHGLKGPTFAFDRTKDYVVAVLLACQGAATTGHRRPLWIHLRRSDGTVTADLGFTDDPGGTHDFAWLVKRIPAGTAPADAVTLALVDPSWRAGGTYWIAAVMVLQASDIYDPMSGARTAPALDLSPVGVATSSAISWTADTPAGTSVSVDVSLDGGQTWQPATNGEPVPGITPGMDLTGKQLLWRERLSTTDTTKTPTLQSLTIQVNHEEWVPLGTFWSLDWDSPDDALEATVTARDRLELLRLSTYQPGAVQQGVSLYTLAEQVLQDAGLQAGEYAIDPALQSIVVPWAWLSPTSHREALRIIAEAALAVVYADRDGVIRIESIGSVPPVLEDHGGLLPAAASAEPPGQVANEIVVTTQPLPNRQPRRGVYRSTTPVTVRPG
ncbi:MAG: hypothetical protein IMW98_04205 [Firmicutes bacterium]|nr:hypothetical protein [Bacillota bacterium]